MSRVFLLQTYLKKMAGSILGFVLFAYFLFHLVQGERGYFALQGVKARQTVAEQQLTDLQSKRLELEHRVKLLRPDSLDKDMLEERARVVLNYTNTDEVVILNQTKM